MDAPLRPIVRFLLWDYDRMSVPYLILSILILIAIVCVPPAWIGDPMALLTILH
jgi:hypothetical protein